MVNNENDIPSLKEAFKGDPITGIYYIGCGTISLLMIILLSWCTIHFWDIQKLAYAYSTYNFTGAFSNVAMPIISIVAAGITFITFWAIYEANEKQNDFIKKQQFEDVFFRLIDNHHRIVEAMDIRQDETFIVMCAKRDCFKYFYSRMKERIKSLCLSESKSYKDVQELYKGDLHHYYRFIYHILKFVKDSKLSHDDKYKYTSIFRAVFSPFELYMLFHNGLHPYGEKLKPLLEEYSFLKNMDKDMVIDKLLFEKYHNVAYPESDDRKALLEDWKKTYYPAHYSHV